VGPGGYVSAIRAGQLGLDVVLVEQGVASMAGWAAPVSMSAAFRRRPSSMRPTPTSGAAEQAKSAPFGLRVEHPTIEFRARTIEWKNGIVGRLTSGVGRAAETTTGSRSCRDAP